MKALIEMDDENLAPLEKIFQQVEEESERRAELDAVDLRKTQVESEEKQDNTDTLKASRSRRRASISISRFGQLSDESTKGAQAPPTPNSVSAIASRSPFFQALKNDSTTSVASGASWHPDEAAHTEEVNHVTQMHKIVGRQSLTQAVGGLLPRRLSRSRSANVLEFGDANVLIGVSVEEKRVESTLTEEEDGETSVASVHALGSLRTQASQTSMAGPTPRKANWFTKAKGFTQKFRRKRLTASVGPR